MVTRPARAAWWATKGEPSAITVRPSTAPAALRRSMVTETVSYALISAETAPTSTPIAGT